MTPEQLMENTPFPISFSCVDMIVFIRETRELVFIKKPQDNYLRIPGGFVDVTDLSYSAAAKREMKEEINLFNVDDYKKHGSFLIHDIGRYEKGLSKHRLRTHLFSFEISKWEAESLKPGDDASEVITINVELLNDIAWVNTHVLATHIPLLYTWFATFQK